MLTPVDTINVGSPCDLRALASTKRAFSGFEAAINKSFLTSRLGNKLRTDGKSNRTKLAMAKSRPSAWGAWGRKTCAVKPYLDRLKANDPKLKSIFVLPVRKYQLDAKGLCSCRHGEQRAQLTRYLPPCRYFFALQSVGKQYRAHRILCIWDATQNWSGGALSVLKCPLLERHRTARCLVLCRERWSLLACCKLSGAMENA